MLHFARVSAPGQTLHPQAIPLPGIPDFKDMIADAIRFFAELLQKSAVDEFVASAQTIQRVPFPSFEGDWIGWMIGNMWGLALAMSVLVITWTALRVMFTRNFSPLMRVGKTLPLLAVYGGAFIFVMTLLAMVSDSLSQFGIFAAKRVAGTDDWITLYKPPSVTDIIDSTWTFFVLKAFGKVMSLEVEMIYISLYLFAILGPIALLARDAGKAGDRLWRWTVSGAVACAVTKPVITLLFAVGVFIIKFVPATSNSKVVAAMLFVQLGSIFAFFFIFWLANHQYVKVFGDHNTKSEIDGGVDVNKLPSEERVTQAVIESRSSTLARIDPVEVTRVSNQSSVSLQDVAIRHLKEDRGRVIDVGVGAATTAVTGNPAAGAKAAAASQVVRGAIASKKEREN